MSLFNILSMESIKNILIWLKAREDTFTISESCPFDNIESIKNMENLDKEIIVCSSCKKYFGGEQLAIFYTTYLLSFIYRTSCKTNRSRVSGRLLKDRFEGNFCPCHLHGIKNTAKLADEFVEFITQMQLDQKINRNGVLL